MKKNTKDTIDLEPQIIRLQKLIDKFESLKSRVDKLEKRR